jgi:hypothetical protein
MKSRVRIAQEEELELHGEEQNPTDDEESLPDMETAEVRQNGCYISQQERGIFMNQLLLPAIREVCPIHTWSHYPMSHRHRLGKMLARNQENRNKEQV